jgi:pyruvate carboxylase
VVRAPSGRSCAGYELGAGTAAMFPREDRNSLHRLKADESYQIGEVGHPV